MPESRELKIITSPHNKEVKELTGLIQKQGLRKKQGVFIAEGSRLVFDLLKRKKELVKKIFIQEGLDYLTQMPGQIRAVTLSEKLFLAVSSTKTPQGIMAVVEIPKYQKDDIFTSGNPLILVLEDVRDPGNMGTIFRTAEAGGCSGVVLLGGCTDPFSPKCIRSSMGSTVHVPIVSYDNIGLLNNDLIKHGISLFIADLDGEDYTYMDYTGPCGFLIGNEANGVSLEAKNTVKKRVTIPMIGEVESLNAGVSASVLVFEAARQRRPKG